jgi:hypothetical protein
LKKIGIYRIQQLPLNQEQNPLEGRREKEEITRHKTLLSMLSFYEFNEYTVFAMDCLSPAQIEPERQCKWDPRIHSNYYPSVLRLAVAAHLTNPLRKQGNEGDLALAQGAPAA